MDELTPYNFMQTAELPPSSNRGAERTTQTGLISCVDWLQVTFPTLNYMQEIYSIFKCYFDELSFLDVGGKYGYKSCLWCNGIFIFYEPHSMDMGTHLQVTGEGFRFLESSNKYSLIDFFTKISQLDVSYNISRIDVAIDDFKGYFKIPQIVKKVDNGEVSSRFRYSTIIRKVELATGNNQGNTVYFGSPTGRLQIRMYEKNHEMNAKGVEHDFSTWNRTELQLRDTRALQTFNLILNNSITLMETITGILNNYMRILTENKNDSNRRRWPTWRNWERFINNINKIKISDHIIEKDLMDTYLWLRRQVSVSLVKIQMAGFSVEDLLKEGKNKITEKELREIYQYIKKEAHKGQFE